ncbi:MAG: hypothetical protein ABI452_01345 [Candidatus Limnocylindrales bacterium]
MLRSRRGLLSVAVALAVILAVPVGASANHSWNNYHWARTANPFTIKLGNNVSGLWGGMLVTASSDWSQSSVLDTTIVAGGTSAKSCRPTAGRVEVCSANYRNTGWLGVAQIWISSSHITQGTVKNNDYYFGSSSYAYNNTAEMQHVICQEIGHTFGLGHTSEDGSSQNSCMDYYHNTSGSDLTSTHPNNHDYEQLATIYAHFDSTTTIGSAPGSNGSAAGNDASSWGRLVAGSRTSGESVFELRTSASERVITFVIWAN